MRARQLWPWLRTQQSQRTPWRWEPTPVRPTIKLTFCDKSGLADFEADGAQLSLLFAPFSSLAHQQTVRSTVESSHAKQGSRLCCDQRLRLIHHQSTSPVHKALLRTHSCGLDLLLRTHGTLRRVVKIRRD